MNKVLQLNTFIFKPFTKHIIVLKAVFYNFNAFFHCQTKMRVLSSYICLIFLDASNISVRTKSFFSSGANITVLKGKLLKFSSILNRDNPCVVFFCEEDECKVCICLDCLETLKEKDFKRRRQKYSELVKMLSFFIEKRKFNKLKTLLFEHNSQFL